MQIRIYSISYWTRILLKKSDNFNSR